MMIWMECLLPLVCNIAILCERQKHIDNPVHLPYHFHGYAPEDDRGRGGSGASQPHTIKEFMK